LDVIASEVHHASPLIVFVDELEGTASLRSADPIIITPVVLFLAKDADQAYRYKHVRYTFAQCAAGSNSELDSLADWIEKYVKAYGGSIATNFDERRQTFINAPLSYQRLISKTYDRVVIEHFEGAISADRIDSINHAEITTQYSGETHMGHNFNVSARQSSTSIPSSTTSLRPLTLSQGLEPAQKAELERMVQTLKTDLDSIKGSHPDETQAIADALQKATAQASKPQGERKPSMFGAHRQRPEGCS